MIEPPAPSRRPRLIAALGAVVLVGGLAISCSGGHDEQSPEPVAEPAATSTVPVTDTYDAHLAAARDAAAGLLSSLVVPDGATRLEAQPAGGDVGEEIVGPSDPSISQTAWWTVPVGPVDLLAQLFAHPPAGSTAQDAGSSTSIDGVQVGEVQFTLPSASPTAYSDVILLVRVKALGDGSVVRADTFTAAYDVRNPGSLLADVKYVVVSTSSPDSGEREATFTAASDPATLERLVDAFQELPASAKPSTVASCPPQQSGAAVTDTLTFHDAGGSSVLTARLQPHCWGQVEVSRDGVKLQPTLDPGDLDALLSRSIPHAVPVTE